MLAGWTPHRATLMELPTITRAAFWGGGGPHCITQPVPIGTPLEPIRP
jgi:agmatine/peptidylarginine deiminase